MSTSPRSYWFFDTAQQEIFICVLLRPCANRWGLTSVEWQIPTTPAPHGETAQIRVANLKAQWPNVKASMVSHLRPHWLQSQNVYEALVLNFPTPDAAPFTSCVGTLMYPSQLFTLVTTLMIDNVSFDGTTRTSWMRVSSLSHHSVCLQSSVQHPWVPGVRQPRLRGR